MGFLADIRSGKRDALEAGVFTVVFWFFAGLGLGAFASAVFFDSAEGASATFALIGSVVGLGVGFYGAWGKSILATVLSIPGLFVMYLALLMGFG